MINYVRKKILEYVDVDEDFITEDTNMILDLHMNSYDCVNIIGKIETELRIEIPDIEIRNLQTVGDLSRFLEAKMR